MTYHSVKLNPDHLRNVENYLLTVKSYLDIKSRCLFCPNFGVPLLFRVAVDGEQRKKPHPQEVLEGEKGGWKDVDEPTSAVESHAFQQEFPSLGDEQQPSQRLELRPQTVRWGEKQINNKHELDGVLPGAQYTAGPPPHHHPPMGMVYMPVAVVTVWIGQCFVIDGRIKKTYHNVSELDGVLPGAQYTTGPPPHHYPPMGMVYMPVAELYYVMKGNFITLLTNTTLSQMYSAPPPLHPAVPAHAKEDSRDKSEVQGQNNNHWGDDEGTSQSVTPDTTSSVGYVSPYTQPFPGKVKQERPEPTGKEEKRPERITYHGRTSSHSSLSEPPDEETSPISEDKPDPSSAPRVLSRTIPKRQLKAFPTEEDADSKKEAEEVSTSWEEEEVEKGASIWEDRQRHHDGPWAPLPEVPINSDRFFEESYETEVKEDMGRHHQPTRRTGEFRSHKDRRLIDDGQRKALRDATEYISMLSLNEPKKITIAQKPKPVIAPTPIESVTAPAPMLPVRSTSGAPASNYWEEKQAERDRIAEEDERRRREEQKAEASKTRQQQYQDYRDPGDYGVRRAPRAAPRPDRPRVRREGEFKVAKRADRKRPASHRATAEEDHFEPFSREDSSRDPSRSERDPSRDRSRDKFTVSSRPTRGSGEARDRGSRFNYYEDPDRFYYERPSLKAKRSSDKRRQPRVVREQPEGESAVTEDPVEEGTTERVDENRRGSVEGRHSREEDRHHREREGSGEHPEESSTLDQEDHRDREKRERRNPNEKYEREMYERPEFTTYRRLPRSGDSRRGDRDSSRRKARIDKYKNGEVPPRKSDKTRRVEGEEGEDEVSADQEPRSKSTTSVRRSKEGDDGKSLENRPPRKVKKTPSIVYYSANPADRVKTAGSHPTHTRVPRGEGKPKTERKPGDHHNNNKGTTKDTKTKKDTLVKKDSEEKEEPTRKVDKSKTAKSIEKSLEMARLKKMTQAGVDLLSIGIYAVDGKDVDRDSLDNDFVEVVRKKSKKEPEQSGEKKNTAAPAASNTKKKGKKPAKQKKVPMSQEEAKQNTTVDKTSTAPSTTAVKNPTTWTNQAQVDLSLSAIWANNPPQPAGKKNAWDKPLTFADKQSLDAREMLPPISGESSSLFSSAADLAKKDNVWRGDSRPPRFSRERVKERVEAKKEPSDPGSPLDIIPPGVEDLFGLKSDGEDDKPSLQSLVALEPTVVVVPNVVGSSLPQAREHVVVEEAVERDQVSKSPGQISAETSTQTTPPAVRSLPLVEETGPTIPSTSVMSLTDQLREIGGAPPETSQFFMQGSPLIHSLVLRGPNSLLGGEVNGVNITQQPGPPPDGGHHIMPSPHQMGVSVGNSNQVPLIGAHLTSSNLSNLGRPTNELFKSYGISPNKIYPASNPQTLNLFSQFTTPHSYASPSMSPIPGQMNPFSPFGQKPNSPKLGALYNSPQGSFDALDPSGGMMSFTQSMHKAPQSALSSQHLFYQRGMVTPQEMYYKLQPHSNTHILSPRMVTPQEMYYKLQPHSNTHILSPRMVTPQEMYYKLQPHSNTHILSPRMVTPQEMYYKLQPHSNTHILSPRMVTPQEMYYKLQPHSNTHILSPRMVTPQEMYYKLQPQENILLQSDMSKHLDAKPFNPGAPNVMGMRPMGHHHPHQMPPRPPMFKPELLQQVMMQQQNGGAAMGMGYKAAFDKEPIGTRPQIMPHPTEVSSINTAGDYGISPNKIYPASNPQTLNLFSQFTTPHSYASPSMSPIPGQMNPFSPFGQKPNSPKLGALYNSPQGSFDALDPSGGMMSFTQSMHKAPQSALSSQHLFYQRGMVTPQEMYYKLQPQENILLQSDMSKHLDAKPFNPGAPNVMGMRPMGHHHPHQMPPRPPMFKPELLQQVMMQQQNGGAAMGMGYKAAFDKEPIGTRPQIMPHPTEVSSINTAGLMGQQQFRLPNVMFPSHPTAPPPPPPRQEQLPQPQHFPQQQHHIQQQQAAKQQQQLTQQMQQSAVAAAHHQQQQQQHSRPRVKLARDGRMHRMPDVRNSNSSKYSGGSFLPPAVQQHMQQQSLAQIQQYTSAISARSGKKETLPDSMKPSPTKVSPALPEKTPAAAPVEPTPSAAPPPTSVEKVIVEETPTRIVEQQDEPEQEVKPAPTVPVEKEGEGKEEVKEQKPKSVIPTPPSRSSSSSSYEKRKYEPGPPPPPRNSYRRRGNYGYDYNNYYHHERPPYRGEPERFYDDRRGGGYRGGGRGFPPPMYRGYPPPPPPPHRDFNRRGAPPSLGRY
eukprot:sb/3460518/